MTSPNAVAVFPGQGSQRVGMGKALAEHSAAARAVFEEVDAALGEKLSLVIFEGPQERLTLTANAQPALMATSVAAVRAYEEALGHPLQDEVSFLAGHSLGEYSALAGIGALSVSDAARVLRLRGEAMQEAVAVGEGAMAVILGLEVEAVEAIARDATEAAGVDTGSVCTLANDNAEGQAVLSGHRPVVEIAVVLAKAKGARRSMLLDVSAPFHCSLMAPAAARLAAALTDIDLKPPARPIITNVTAQPESDAAVLKRLLVEQVTARVRWRECIQIMAGLGCRTMIEFGAGKVLTGLARRAFAGATLVNISEPGDLPSSSSSA